MEEFSPLDSKELREIDECLNAGNLDEAQRRLASVGDAHPLAASYLAVRLLYLRERLAPEAVAERLRDLLGSVPSFRQARSLLTVAEAGVPGRLSLNPGAPASFAIPASLSSPAPFSNPAPFLNPAAVADTLFPAAHSNVTEDPELDRPTWSPDSLPNATTLFPAAEVPPSGPPRRIEVDTRGGHLDAARLLNGAEPPVSRSLPPVPSPRPQRVEAKPEGRYTYLSQPPPAPDSADAGADSNAHSNERAKEQSAKASVPPPREAIPPRRPPGLSVPPHSVPIRVAPSTAREGRYSLTGVSAESLFPPAPSRATVTDPSAKPTAFRVPMPSTSGPDSRGSSLVTQELLHGNAFPAQRHFEDAASLAVVRVESVRGDSFAEWAEEASTLLMTSPVTHFFGPFDRSLHSLARLDLALDVLYYRGVPEPVAAAVSLLGAYVGETLRTAHRGVWKPTTEPGTIARVIAGGYVWEPFRLVQERLAQGEGSSLYRTLAPALAKEGTLAWFTCAKELIPPPKLWTGPLNANVLHQMGQELLESVWSLSCAQRFGGELDGSLASLAALDQLLDVLSRSARTLSLEQPWVMRLTALAAGYVGEVLRRQVGGQWVPTHNSDEDPLVFRLSGGIDATPISNILNRLTSQKRFQLESYVRVLLRRLS